MTTSQKQPTFNKGLTVIYKCGHEVPYPDDFEEVTGRTMEQAQKYGKIVECSDCLKQPTTVTTVNMAGYTVSVPAIKLPQVSNSRWD